MSEQSYPLCWPQGWKRTAPFNRQKSRFGDQSIDRATQAMLMEIRRLGCPDYNVIISTNLILRKTDGLPTSNQPAPADPGVAVYFKINGKQMALACDCWSKVQDNMRAITNDIEATRGKLRWGVGSVERAFAGYAALPSPDDWREILGFEPGALPPWEDITAVFRDRAMRAHPDRGGSNDAMARLNRGLDAAKREYNR